MTKWSSQHACMRLISSPAINPFLWNIEKSGSVNPKGKLWILQHYDQLLLVLKVVKISMLLHSL